MRRWSQLEKCSLTGKFIFESPQECLDILRIRFGPEHNVRVYECLSRQHYHYQNNTKKNQKARAKWREKRKLQRRLNTSKE